MPVQERGLKAEDIQTSNPDIERIYHDWDEALSKNDFVALAKLYVPDVEFGFHVLKNDRYHH
jgi:ketosteroid isomerase-like protein